MKKQLLVMLALAAMAFNPARAQYQQPPPQINVSGTAEIKVAPDEVDISAGVETRDTQLDAARRQNDERVASVLAFLNQAGVPDKQVQTDAVEVQPDYGPGDEQIEPRFYRIRKTIEIKLTTITNLETVLAGLLNNGGNHLFGVEFRTTDLRKYRDQARLMAVQAAKEKAAALGGELDVKCGKPININAQDYGGYFNWAGGNWNWRNNGMYMNSSQNVAQAPGGGSDAGSETVSIGQISVSATVNVSFSIQ